MGSALLIVFKMVVAGLVLTIVTWISWIVVVFIENPNDDFGGVFGFVYGIVMVPLGAILVGMESALRRYGHIKAFKFICIGVGILPSAVIVYLLKQGSAFELIGTFWLPILWSLRLVVRAWYLLQNPQDHMQDQEKSKPPDVWPPAPKGLS